MSFPAACLLRAGVVCALGACSMFVHAAQRTFVASTGSDAGRTFGNNALTENGAGDVSGSLVTVTPR